MRLTEKIGAAFTAYGLFFAAIMGIAVIFAFFAAEESILDKFLLQAVTQVRDSATPDEARPLPRGVTLYLGDPPREFAGLPEGMFELEQYRHVAVFRHPSTNELVYLELDATTVGLDAVLGRILFGTLIVLIVAVVVGIWISRYVSGQLMRPMNLLVQRIDDVEFADPALEPLPHDDEIGLLSRRFATTIELLAERDRRERDFTRFASHELRTPITVMGGTTAILRSEPALTERGERAVDRAEVAVDRMHRLVETFLFLGRSGTAPATTQVPASHAREEILRFGAAGRDGKTDPQMNIDLQDGSFRCNETLLSIVLENLVSNALRHGTGPLSVRIAPPTIELNNQVADSTAPGHGFGLEIVTRICERLDIEFATSVCDGNFSASLRFPDEDDRLA